jgi:5-methylcytosine-specific restriction endonuclease McrA
MVIYFSTGLSSLRRIDFHRNFYLCGLCPAFTITRAFTRCHIHYIHGSDYNKFITIGSKRTSNPWMGDCQHTGLGPHLHLRDVGSIRIHHFSLTSLDHLLTSA